MSDETNYTTSDASNTSSSAGAAGTAERVGFCQDCGIPLTRETVRPVGAGVFCEPCLAARVGTTATGNAQAGYTTVPPVVGNPGDGPVRVGVNAPRPVLAGFLGLIPGVGAMYNGQYAKGIAHLVVFAVLASLNDHGNGIFGVLVVGWVFYQVFDAYHTAKALLEGRPLPNPFGLNDIGERMGFGRQPGAASGTANSAGAAQAGSSAQAAYTAPSYSSPYAQPYPPPYVPPVAAPDWVGYVPPTNFASAPAAGPYSTPEQTAAYMADQIRAQAMRDAGMPPAAYIPTYTGSDAATAMPPMTPPARRFPVGAIWLIGLGVVFLLFEFGQEWGWSLNMNWVMALVFAGLAALIAARRLHAGVQVACVLRWPVVLATLAVLFALQALEIDHLGLGTTWPVLFIVFGAMLTVERTALAKMTYGAPTYPISGSVAPPMNDAEAERTRAAWASASSTTESHGTDRTIDSGADAGKGGQ